MSLGFARQRVNHFHNFQAELKVVNFNRCPLNWHKKDLLQDFCKLYLICSGEGIIEIESNPYYPTPGQIFLIPAGSIHTYSVLNNNPFQMYWCHFTALSGGENALSSSYLPHFINLKPDEFENFKAKFNELVDYSKLNDPASILKSKSVLLDIIATYIRLSVSKDNMGYKDQNSGLLKRVLNYIDNNINNDLSVERLSAIMHVHPKYFIRYFYKQTGYTPGKYINMLRIEMAKHLLWSTDMPVGEIVEKSGYDSPHYFSRVFRQHVGMSPSEYRKSKTMKINSFS